MTACPHCDEPMTPGDHQTETCAGHGVLVPTASLRQTIRAPAVRTLEAMLPRADEAWVDCPLCGATMHEALVPLPRGGTIELDGCPDCGAWWFDEDEIAKAEAAGALAELPHLLVDLLRATGR